MLSQDVRPSLCVRPTVCHMPVFRRNGLIIIRLYSPSGSQTILHCMCLKKVCHRCLITTLANVEHFSKFLRQLIRKKILYIHITTISISPVIYCYTTSVVFFKIKHEETFYPKHEVCVRIEAQYE